MKVINKQTFQNLITKTRTRISKLVENKKLYKTVYTSNLAKF